LAVEEQFYVVYPALFIAVCAVGHRWPLRFRLGVFLGIVIASSFGWSVYSSPSSIVFPPAPDRRPYQSRLNTDRVLRLATLVAPLLRVRKGHACTGRQP
jgi:nitrate reductase gamma subunit